MAFSLTSGDGILVSILFKKTLITEKIQNKNSTVEIPENRTQYVYLGFQDKRALLTFKVQVDGQKIYE